VCNLSDGRVEVCARGDAASLALFEQALRAGPPASRVDRLERFAADEEAAFDGFEIRA
jgi:acylphosphatase